jgi:DNA polymerase III epsilon subunit-like protein
MEDLPDGYPYFCHDLRQEVERLEIEEQLPENKAEHDALVDAQWVKDVYDKYIVIT